jgi:hypothetical protein
MSLLGWDVPDDAWTRARQSLGLPPGSFPSALSDLSEQGARRMITFVPKTDVLPALKETEENRFERIRKIAAERHRKSDTDGTRRRSRQTAEDNWLI